MSSQSKHKTITSRWPLRAGLAGLLTSSAISSSWAIDIAARLSPAALGQQADLRTGGVTAAIQGAIGASPSYQAQAALSAANLAKAAQAIKDTTASQLKAASQSLTLSNRPLSASSWNGQVLSGLKPVNDTDPALWINAQPLQKDTGSATATVKQTDSNAVLNWQSFDLNKDETLTFDQQGHADWTVLNRVTAGPRDPVTGGRTTANIPPSFILGKIKADGAVYVINPNGIIFGATSQIDVHSFIASSLDVGNPIMSQTERDNFFLNNGILGNGNLVPLASFSYNARDSVIEGDVRIEAGAVIKTSPAPRTISPDAGGFVYLFAPNVENDGHIVTPAGETMMVAAQQVQLIANRYPDGGVASDLTADSDPTFKAVGVNTLFGSSSITAPAVWRLDGPTAAQISKPGSVTNRGVIEADRGVVILNGDFVNNNKADDGTGGIISTDTSITRNGQVFLDARLKLTMNGSVQMLPENLTERMQTNPDGSIEILPDENAETIPQSAIANFTDAQLNALAGKLSLRGRQIDLEPGALVLAPGGTVTADVALADTHQVNFGIYPAQARPQSQPARIYMAGNSSIDVGGLTGVMLPMSANLLTFKPFGNEFADQPLQRQGALRGTELTVDIRQSGISDGVNWVGTPLANVVGFVNNIPRSIDQILTTGGKVTFCVPTASGGGDIVLREGSAINAGGGYVQYESGAANTTKLLTADGRVVDISRASPLDTFVGVAGVSNEAHPHWGANLTNTFVNPLLAQGQQTQPAYVEGHDAGAITLTAPAYAIDGTLYGSVVTGALQREQGILPDPDTANSLKANPSAGPSGGVLSLTGNTEVLISSSVAPLPAGMTIDSALPSGRLTTTALSATVLSQAGFSKIIANFSGHLQLDEDAVLSVLPGGRITLTAGSADIEGGLIARSGAIRVELAALTASDLPGSPTTSFTPTTPDRPHLFDLQVGSKALLDTSGVWVNDGGATPQSAIGGAYIDGGSITLSTDARTALCKTQACTQLAGLGTDTPPIVDLTGDIVLAGGSRLDVSSGGRIGINGQYQLDSAGRVAGKGGDIALQTYVGKFGPFTQPIPPTTTPLAAMIVFSGSDGSPQATADALNSRIRAWGSAQGGILSLQTTAIQIGGDASAIPGALTLPSSFFDGNAFGGYKLTSVAGSLTVAAGQMVNLRQRNFVTGDALALLPPGAKAADGAKIDFLTGILRSAVGLSLSSTLAPLPNGPYDPNVPTPPATVALTIGEGASINGDPGAAISLSVNGRSGFAPAPNDTAPFPVAIAQQFGVAEILGTITAPGGSITLTASGISTLWLGANARLDAAGVAIADSRQPLLHFGKVLDGGNVSLLATDLSSQIIALHGAMIDVSGAASAFDILQDGKFGPSFALAPFWTDAGSITLTAPTLFYDGGFAAHGGASAANGGSLTLGVPQSAVGTEAITVKAGGNSVPMDLTEAAYLTSDPSALNGQVNFLADRLKGSGISDVTLSANPAQGDAISTDQQGQGRFAPGTITFSGNADIEGLDNLFLDASRIQLADVTGPVNPNGCNVCLDANYVALRGAGQLNRFRPVAGTGVLQVKGNTIDIAAGGTVSGGAGQFLSLSGIADARFISAGDIRLRVPSSNIPLDQTPGALPAGELLTAGNQTLQAQQVYPVSSIDFTLKSTALDGTIKFLDGGTPAAPPLSAGGQVTVSAAHIVQSGRLVAPLGVIRLGGQTSDDLSPLDPGRAILIATQSVTITPDSVTSVSLNGQTVPFGVTTNNTNWSYNSIFGQPLNAAPQKGVFVSGKQIDVQSDAGLKATIDLRGGGDLQAMEFVPGIGGSRDVLKDPNVYAVLPGYNPNAAPVDLDFLLQQGDTLPAAGQSVTLSLTPGSPAQSYVLLPAHYATLPGAYRVRLVPNSQDARANQNMVLTDGTYQTVGRFTNPATGTSDARAQLFDVQKSDVWRQYSEIDQNTGNAFFGAKAAGEASPPPLPADAAHAVFSAVGLLNLDGKILAAPAITSATGDLAAAQPATPNEPPPGLLIRNLSTETLRRLFIGETVRGVGIAAGTTIAAIGSDSVTLNAPAANAVTGASLTFSGRGAEFDVAARDIAVLNTRGTLQKPLDASAQQLIDDGFLPLYADQLSNLGVDSLLIGGVRSPTEGGEEIAVVANSVEVHNTSAMPLKAPEIILVSGVGVGRDDPNAGIHLQLDRGSVVRADGDLANPQSKTVFIGDDANFISGHGSLLSVSNGAPLTVIRNNLSPANGELNILGDDLKTGDIGAKVVGQSLTLDSGGALRIGSGAIINADNIFVSAGNINIGEVTGRPGGFVVEDDILAQLDNASTLTLRSTTQSINFWGNVNLSLKGPDSGLVFDSAELLARSDGAVTLSAGEIDYATTDTAVKNVPKGDSSLLLKANTIRLGAGDKAFGNFSAVTLNGASEIDIEDTGSLDAAAAALNIRTPGLLINSSANQTFTTANDVTFTGAAGSVAAPVPEFGGSFTLIGQSIDLTANTLIQANAGGMTLEATKGDIHLGDNARILANGYAQPLFDVTRVASGGEVRLVADQGEIVANASARVDVSSPAGFLGHAGSIELVAPQGRLTTANLSINMNVFAGSVANDSGGRLLIDARTLGGPTLSVPSIFTDEVDVHVRGSLLALASDIQADRVTITADRGPLTVDTTIDASGDKGGTISLFGGRGVVLGETGKLLATASDPGKPGGEVTIGTEIGAENLSPDPGIITINGTIDVSNSRNPANGGSVHLRAPLLASGDDVAIDPYAGIIRGASNVTIEAFREFDTSNSAFNGTIDPVAQPDFYGACDASSGAPVCSGTLIDFVQNFGLSPTAQSKFASVAPDTLHLQPGIELVSTGDITVANPWNLGAGFAGPLYSAQDYTVRVNKQDIAYPAGTQVTDNNGVLLSAFVKYKGGLLYVPGKSQIRYLDYRVGGSVTGEPGVLTLRGGDEVAINASISDGFFNTRNVFDADYQDALADWIGTAGLGISTNVTNVGGYLMGGATLTNPVGPTIGPLPQAPYAPDANDISPQFSGKDKIALAGADLFPLLPDANGPIAGFDGNYRAIGSWSYRIAAGAQTDSANPLGLRPLSDFLDQTKKNGSVIPGAGDVVIDGHKTYAVASSRLGANIIYATPTVVRTGTGSIDIAAGHDFILADQSAPGAVYTAGRNSTELPDPGFKVRTVDDPLHPGTTLTIAEATNPTGFLEPNPLLCDLSLICNPYGPLTQPAYPTGSGHLTLVAQQDIIGFEHPTIASPSNAVGDPVPNQQYFAPWLLAQGTSLINANFGAFAPLSAYLTTAGGTFTPPQTSWWINFGSFDQGLMSAGGDVYVRAGRDIQELSVSLPTTARVSGGLSSTISDGLGHTVANIPVVHLTESGDMTVIAGRNLLSGAYYEGTGHAKIEADGSVSASWSQREDFTDPSSPTHPVSTVLALDTGTIDLTSRGDLDIAGIVSGPSLQNTGDPTESLNVSSASVSSYGPASKVVLQSVAGDVRINSLVTVRDTFPSALIENQNQDYNQAGGDSGDAFPGVNFYPSSFEAAALKGDITISDSFTLAASDKGALDLLAGGSLFDSNTPDSRGGARPISTGPSLVETMFDPAAPLTGLGPAPGAPALDLGARLLHRDDAVPNRIYAAGGDFISGQGATNGSSLTEFPLAWEINKPTVVHAARDIVDLSFFGQNLAAHDVTAIIAGRDLYYTGAWQVLSTGNNGFGIPSLNAMNLGGLSLAGPGNFYVEAGRNLGPIVTAAGDIVAGQLTGVSDSTGTGIITLSNTVVAGNRLMLSSQDPTNANQFAASTNDELPRQGANIVAEFGVAKDADYQAMIAKYIDPATATSPRDYLSALVVYLQTVGYPALSKQSAWTVFQSLPETLKDIFVDQVLFSELRVPADPKDCCFKDYDIGYAAIETLYPKASGYTDNFKNGTDVADTVQTGNLDLLHATIKTLQSSTRILQKADGTLTDVTIGGDIMLLGPGGNINIGTTAVEVNKQLTNSALGILTLDNGVIDSFTDTDVLVNQSRILTVQGGDILMWSSNGNLDAGRGAKTTVDFKPLSVIFAPNDLQTINLNGLVSGAGIGTIQSTPDAPAASAFLVAPRGAVNAGDAGLRSSGDLSIAALFVLNASNIASLGTVSGVPQAATVNLGALESSSAVSGQAAQAAEAAVAAAANRGRTARAAAPSIITVEVFIGNDPDGAGGGGQPQ